MRDQYTYHLLIPTRWMDNDIYGHVNNVIYYSYFDTVINTYLIQQGGLDIHAGETIGLCVESHCRYLAPLAFPGTIEAHLRVEKLGNSSVRYEIALFAAAAATPAAQGHFTHVFVNRTTRRPTPLPQNLRTALKKLQTP